jgi:hypothetical protein
MEQTTEELNPPHGGSFVREEDGSLTLVEGTKPDARQPKTEPAAPAGDQE